MELSARPPLKEPIPRPGRPLAPAHAKSRMPPATPRDSSHYTASREATSAPCPVPSDLTLAASPSRGPKKCADGGSRLRGDMAPGVPGRKPARAVKAARSAWRLVEGGDPGRPASRKPPGAQTAAPQYSMERHRVTGGTAPSRSPAKALSFAHRPVFGNQSALRVAFGGQGPSWGF